MIRYFNGIPESETNMSFSYTQHGDYTLYLNGTDSGYIVLRGPGGGGIGLVDFCGPNLPKAYKVFIESRDFHRKRQFLQLPSVPILVEHEHGYEDGKKVILFQKKQQNGSAVIVIRFVRFVQGVLANDFTITACKIHEQLQRDLFNDEYEEIVSPLPLTDKEFDELAQLLSSFLKVQRKYYQERVDSLLKLLENQN